MQRQTDGEGAVATAMTSVRRRSHLQQRRRHLGVVVHCR